MMSFGTGLFTRLLALCLCIEALAAVGEIPPRVIENRPRAEPARIVAAEPPSRWLVRVDGWTLALDEVGKGALALLALPLATEGVGTQETFTVGEAFPFQDLILSTALAEGVDWRLVAAIVAEESGFNPSSESEAGAYGLMQVRAIAARDVDEHEIRSPGGNLRTGVRYLKRLRQLVPAADPHQQLALVLAAYNMGPGHLNDAQALAQRYGLPPQRWYDSVERVLPLLEERAIYSTLPNGYAQGRQTLRYVRRVLDRYEQARRTAPRAHLARGAFLQAD